MNLRSDKWQKNTQVELDFSSSPAGEAREAKREETESLSATHDPESPASTNRWMEEICERENLKQALRQVKGNKGSAGVDGVTVDQLTDYLKQHWPVIREQLRNGTYEPKPVRRVDVETRCAKFYAEKNGRPSLTPGIYFRALLIGYFEGIGAERGIAWRLADSLALRRFVGIALDEYTPDHSTISRTRRLIDLDTHREVFGWVLGVLADRGLLKGQRIAIDATTLEANAAMRSIVRRDTGASYEEFLRGLAKASGIETPTREDLARLDRKRKKRTSNKEWRSPADGDARIAKMKDGRTHLAHKAEHAVDLDTGAVLAVTLQGADQGDTTTLDETLCEAGMAVAEQVGREAELRPHDPPKVNLAGIEETVTDKGYHSGAVVKRMKAYGVRSYMPEKKQKGQRNWAGKAEEQQAVYANRRRVRGEE